MSQPVESQAGQSKPQGGTLATPPQRQQGREAVKDDFDILDDYDLFGPAESTESRHEGKNLPLGRQLIQNDINR
jgi:hypothetical protein